VRAGTIAELFPCFSLSLLDGFFVWRRRSSGSLRARIFVSWERPSSDSPPSLLFSELFGVNFEEEKRK